MSYKTKQQGFTIVELLIVIVVIGILAALVITTFTGIQQKGRNTERTTDLKAVQGQLEAYYAQNGRYPTKANMDDASWVAGNLKGLDKNATADPKNTATFSFAATPTANQYAYQVTASDGTTACDNSTTDCGKYILTAKPEGGGSDIVYNSLN